jgi:hypothetical protein
MPTTATSTTLALKEWGAAVHALLDGRQTILLRKGGIHEKSFQVAMSEGSDRFVLFPTVAHSHAERVRPEHQELLAQGAADVGDDGTFTVRAGIELVDVVAVARSEGLPDIADLHIWTPESIRTDRLEFRPRQALQVLIVRAVRLPRPIVLPRLDAYGGCKSWVDLPALWDGDAGTAVHDDVRLAGDARRVRAAVG